jgi:phage terminase large subunit
MSEITFSDKYTPLFELLTNEYPEVDTVLVSGGRDSGKTFCLGCFVGIATEHYNHRVLYTRQTMSSTNNSITRALDNRLELLEIADNFNFANNDYLSKNGKGLITITGQKTSSGTQTAKLKSLENYSIFITDEGEELENYDDWEKIKRSMRANDVQCLSIISFNPPTKAHWIYPQWYQNIPEGFNGVVGNVMYIHTTYLDNGKENMALHNWNEYERLRGVYEYYLSVSPEERVSLPKKTIREYKNYKNTILGGFRDTAEGVIFDYTIGDYVDGEYDVYAMDQGFNDPTTLIKINVDKNQKKIYVKQCYYAVGKTETDIFNSIKEEVKQVRIWCDSAVPMFIEGLRRKGLNIKPCIKPKIVDSIYALLDWELIVDPNSKEMIIELDNYKWSDKKQDEPIDAFNHCIDPLRYGFTHKMSERVSQVL